MAGFLAITGIAGANPPKVPELYLDALGVHMPLTLAQLHRIASDVAASKRRAASDPLDFEEIADLELGWQPGDRVGDVRVTYVYYCSVGTAYDDGIKYVVISRVGKERTTGYGDPSSPYNSCVSRK